MKPINTPPVASAELLVQTVANIVIFPVDIRLTVGQRDPFRFFCRVGPQCLPHAGFHTQAQRDGWLAMRGLALDGQRAVGGFRIAHHRSRAAYLALRGESHLYQDQGVYTRAVVTADSDGLRTVHLLEADCEREVLDYDASERRDRAGRTALAEPSCASCSANDDGQCMDGIADIEAGGHCAAHRTVQQDAAEARAVQSFRNTLGLPPRNAA